MNLILFSELWYTSRIRELENFPFNMQYSIRRVNENDWKFFAAQKSKFSNSQILDKINIT